MKKFFVVIAIICLLPINVFAYNVNTSFDSDNCVLTVSGTQSGHDASVSLFNGNNLLGFKTGPINNENFSVDFVLTYDQDTTIDITVSNENGGNEISKNNVVVPACVVVRAELIDNNENSLIMNEGDYEIGDTFTLDKYTAEEILAMVDAAQNPEQRDAIQSRYDNVMSNLGDYRKLVYYVNAFVKNSNNDDVSFDGYHEGFILNIKLSKAEFDALKGLKIARYNEGEEKLESPLDYDYDEDAEMLSVAVDYPGAFIMYLDNEYEFKDNTGNLSYNPKKDKSLTIKVDADYSKFVDVFLDGRKVNNDNYTSESGSTIITLKENYMKSLSSGQHQLIIHFNDGSASTILNIGSATNPFTGDNVLFYVFMLGLSAIGLVGTGYHLRKRRLN